MELNSQTTVVVTGGSGFIGSNLVRALNEIGVNRIIVVDHFGHNEEKWRNLVGLDYETVSDVDSFYDLFSNKSIDLNPIDLFIHLGGRADTKADIDTVFRMNYNSSVACLSLCSELGIPIFYASSASTYGNTDLFSDNHELIRILEPNNAYGMSKHIFDLLIMKQPAMQLITCGLKFFNVYGPGEMHKGHMASIIGRALKTKEILNLYHMDGWERDFIYIDDVIKIILFLIQNDGRGIFNVGSGKSSSWENVYDSLIKAKPELEELLDLQRNPKLVPSFFDENYQRYSKADISKLRDFGYKAKILSLTEGVKRYNDAI